MIHVHPAGNPGTFGHVDPELGNFVSQVRRVFGGDCLGQLEHPCTQVFPVLRAVFLPFVFHRVLEERQAIVADDRLLGFVECEGEAVGGCFGEGLDVFEKGLGLLPGLVGRVGAVDDFEGLVNF